MGGPTGATLVEVDENVADFVTRKNSLAAPTIGGVAAQLNKQQIDEDIQMQVVGEMCYHL